jgi:hypothetical protein
MTIWYYYESPSSTGLGPQEQGPAYAASVHVRGRMSFLLSLTDVSEFGEKATLNRQEPTGTAPQASWLPRPVRGWSWQSVGFFAQRVIILSLIPGFLTVPHKHGHWCCLCYSVWPETTSANADDR